MSGICTPSTYTVWVPTPPCRPRRSPPPNSFRGGYLHNVDLLLTEHDTQLHTFLHLARSAEHKVGIPKADFLDSAWRQEGEAQHIEKMKIVLEVIDKVERMIEEVAMMAEDRQSADRCCHGNVTGDLDHLCFVLCFLHTLFDKLYSDFSIEEGGRPPLWHPS